MMTLFNVKTCSFVQTSDGTGHRDYVHVMDLSEGHVLAVQHILEENRFIHKYLYNHI